MVTDEVSSPSGGSNILHIAVSDAGVQSQSTGSEDSVGYYERRHSGSAHKQTVGYGDEASQLLENVSDFNQTAPSTGTKYIEFKRTSATSFTVTRYSDEFVTTMETAKTVTIPSTLQSLRYIKIQNKQENPSGGTFNGTVTKVQFWNNTTSVTGTPTWTTGTGGSDKDNLTNVQIGSRLEETDTRKMFNYADPLTFQDDFSSYANQTAADTAYPTTDSAKMRVNITNDNIDVDFERTGSNDLIYYDLGSGSVNDTKWVLRFKWVIDSVSSSNVQGCIGLASNTGSYHTSQDGVFLEVVDTSGANSIRMNDPNNALPDVSGGAAMTNTVSTGTRYVEIARTGATSATISFSSTSAYTKDTESKTFTIENVTGLRYFKIFNNSGGTASGQVNGTIDDVEFYNGVTSTSNYWQEIGA